MKPRHTLFALFALVYLATGIYIVRGNEQAVVRRFGKAQTTLAGSGLHLDLPWPFTQVDRVNLNAVRTLTLSSAVPLESRTNPFLQAGYSDRQSEYLTGDKNLLHLQVSVQYRVSNPRQFLFGSEAPERHLRCLIDALVTNVVAQSGVDFVHPLGLNELRRLLFAGARPLPDEHGLGLVIDDVTIGDARPPVAVKQAFLDVSNARAEQERMINEAQAQAERSLAQANAESLREADRAEAERHQLIAEARGAADRFLSLIGEFQPGKNSDPPERQANLQARNLAVRRLYLATLAEILPKLGKKVFVDEDRPVDLTLEQQPTD